MGFTTNVPRSAEYTIKIDDVQGENIENVDVYLVDRLLNMTHNLSERGYTFISRSAVNNDRFELLFEERSVLSTDNVNELSSSLSVFPNPTQGVVKIVSRDVLDANVTVLDVNNRVVLAPTTMTGSSLDLDLSSISSGVYFIQIQTTDNTSIERVIRE